MKRSAWLPLSLCCAVLPLLTGCGGCGGPPTTVEAMRRARGSWGADEEVETAQIAPAAPAEPGASSPPELQPPAPQPSPAAQPAAVASPTAAPQTTPAVSETPVAAAQPAGEIELITIPTGADRLRRIVSMSKSPEFRRLAILNQPLSVAPGAGEAISAAESPAPTAIATSTTAAEATQHEAAAEAATSQPAENLLQPPASAAKSTASLLPQAKALADAGNETDADRMLLGEAMLRDRLEDWPFPMRWAPALRRPAPWLRAGVAFEVSTVDLRGAEMGVLPAKDRALERDFGEVGGDVLDLGGELAEKILAQYLTLLRSGALGPTLAPRAAGPVDRGRPLPVRLCGGLMVFGPGEERLLKAHAERLGLDLLIVFEVRAKRNTNDANLPVNDTSAKIIDIVGDREIYSSATVRNLDVLETRKNPVAGDPIEPVAADIRSFLETQLPLGDFPEEVRPENVRARIGNLIDQALASKNALPYLVEIKALQLKGYLSGLEARAAYIAILGEPEGEALHSGSAQARIEALDSLLPRAPKSGAGAAEPAPTPSPSSTETVNTGD